MSEVNSVFCLYGTQWSVLTALLIVACICRDVGWDGCFSVISDERAACCMCLMVQQVRQDCH